MENQESKLSLREQRDNVRAAYWRATGRGHTDEADRLQGHLIELEEQLRKDKK